MRGDKWQEQLTPSTATGSSRSTENTLDDRDDTAEQHEHRGCSLSPPPPSTSFPI